MNRPSRPFFALIAALLVALSGLAPARAQGPLTTDELEAVADARTQAGSPDANFGSGFLFVSTANGHISFVRFDLLVLPANAVVEAARLELDAPTQNDGPNNVELGRVDGVWEEDTLTWATQPAITWGGPVANISGPTLATWDVTALVQAWHSGAVPNNGFALRGDGGEPLSFSSKEAGLVPPALVVRYRIPPSEGPRPDLGDAPDSSNNVGIPNTAYPTVNGNFPTVWNVPVGQPAGPRHANQRIEAVLGQHLSRENEADGGLDEDTANNILDGGTDNSDNDRLDDGWRNRNVAFPDCQPTTLIVRVRKGTAATLDRMFLNVWFDGNHDGDWADRQLCTPEGEELAIPAQEWIVQDYFVDLSSIPAGDFVDIKITTETVLNTTPRRAHWMRFTLSERRAVQTSNGRADGRGPHPSVAPNGFQFGETEDVLQRPQPPGEDGTLELEKRVITGPEPVDPSDMVTYRIRLRHKGGTQPIEARIQDILPWPSHLHPIADASGVRYIDVSSSTGGAVPLQANFTLTQPSPSSSLGYRISWHGSLAPDSEVTLSFKVHVIPFCEPGDQTMTIVNQAQAKARGGPVINAEDSFIAKCFGYIGDNIGVELSDPIESPIDLDDYSLFPLSGFIENKHPISVTLGLRPQLLRGTEELTPTGTPELERITLGPGERRQFDFVLPLPAEDDAGLDAPVDEEFTGKLAFCILPAEVLDTCPDRVEYPELSGESKPVNIRIRPNDLGDAPDSTNHAGAAMAAYAGTPANFPTVFDPATGQPQGPRHAHPRPLHLGQQVSREAEADIGPDQDPSNNILPANNQPNLDRFDDGSRLNPPAGNCQTTTAEVRVSISAAAWQWFDAQDKPAYLNAWLDSNRDGDWADGFNCQSPQGQANVVEHIIIDHQIDVAALGPGLHTLTVPTGRVAWPAQLAERPAWLRFTLSERESNKPLQFAGISYGDGRGYNTPFRTGETEDHLMRPGDEAGGLDVAVQLEGRAGAERVTFKIVYANLGAGTASGASLTFRKPQQLRDPEIVLLQAPGIPAANITESTEELRFALPALSAGAGGTIVVGWDTAAPGEYEAAVQVKLNGDTNSANNQDTVTVQRRLPEPIVAAVVAGDKGWGHAETTCRDQIDLTGLGAPGEKVRILLDGAATGEALMEEEGLFHFLLKGLSEGSHTIVAEHILSPRDAASGLHVDVDTSLPVDPMSLSFIDSKGRSVHPSTRGYSWGVSQTGTMSVMRSGETYEIGIDSCLDDPNLRLSLDLGDGETLVLSDEDGDGRYTGSFTYNPAAQLTAASEFRLTVTAGAVQQSFAIGVEPLGSGVVRDRSSGSPLAGASVLALAEQAGGDGAASASPWPAVALGQPNPQSTGADGVYSFAVPGGSSRVAVERQGYQPYRSWPIESAGGLSPDVSLTPSIAGTPTQTIYITADGFEPAVLRVAPGSVVEWVNADLAEHSATGAAWDSGAIGSGERYRVKLDKPGSYSYQDGADPSSSATIIVGSAVSEGFRLFLPLIRR